jgi:hypothetical protein
LIEYPSFFKSIIWAPFFNTLWMGDADLRLYITTVQDGWRKSAFFNALAFHAHNT